MQILAERLADAEEGVVPQEQIFARLNGHRIVLRKGLGGRYEGQRRRCASLEKTVVYQGYSR